MNIQRRKFLTSAAATTAFSIIPSTAWSAPVKPSDRLTMGFIGMGKRNFTLLRSFLRYDTQVLAVCEVDATRRKAALDMVNEFYEENPEKKSADCRAYNDFRDLVARDDIDAVCIGTPDHWHTINSLAALRSGKDVFCEKPLTHNIHESIVLMDAVEKEGRVLQTGSMQRSSREFRIACELVQNGVIGDIDRVECAFGGPAIACDLPEEPMEAGLDWDLWLGPAPKRPYNSTLSPRGKHDHFPHWRRYREYGGGSVTDWGAHHVDIAQWGLGMDNSGPVEILPSPDGPNAQRGVTLVYNNGKKVIHKNGFGVHFFGSNGEVKVNRGRFALIVDGKEITKHTGSEDEVSLDAALNKASKEFLADAKIKLYKSDSHNGDFLQCVKDRKKPITSEIVGARTAICCHLINLAYYHGETMQWDPASNQFVGGTGNPAWLTREFRSPWKV